MLFFEKIKPCLMVIIVIMVTMFSRPIFCLTDEKTISLDLQEVSIQDVIHAMAKLGNLNVILSPGVHGLATVHFNNMPALKALDIVLETHGLARWSLDNILFIVPREEWFKRQQDELKLQSLLNESSPLATRWWSIRYAKATDIAAVLQNGNSTLLSKRGQVRVDARTNTVCVLDQSDRLKMVAQLIKELDIPVRQVLIEAHLASIDSDYERALGIGFSTVSTSETSTGVANALSQYTVTIAKLANHTLLNAQLAALESEGHGELISSPSLFTANQQTATIEAGEEIPYQEITKSGATAVAFKKAVLSLKVTPQIMPGQQILLQLQINQDKPSNHVILGVPAISTRQMSTNILVKNGQTVVLGGIYEANQENEQQHVPFLGTIPVIGWLFSQRQTEKNKRELLIFVTPKIMA